MSVMLRNKSMSSACAAPVLAGQRITLRYHRKLPAAATVDKADGCGIESILLSSLSRQHKLESLGQPQ